MIIKTLVFCLASAGSLAGFHLATSQVEKYQTAQRELVGIVTQPVAPAAGSFAQAGQAAEPDGLAGLRAALQ